MTDTVSKMAIRISWVVLALCCLFLISPLIAIVPLSFNSERYFSYPMPGLSIRWYEELLSSPKWIRAFENSFLIASGAALLASVSGTAAALGLVRIRALRKAFLSALLISPMIVPPVVIALGAYLFFAKLDLTESIFGIIVAHSILGIPTVILVVGAAFASFDQNLIRAAASLGANPFATFYHVITPLLAPALLSGVIFAYVASLDEYIITSFLAGPEQRTLPLQMWDGIREDVTPVIMAAATVLILVSSLSMVCLYLLRSVARRNAIPSKATEFVVVAVESGKEVGA